MTWKEDEAIGELLALLHGDGGHYTCDGREP